MRRGNTGGGIRQTHPSAQPALPDLKPKAEGSTSVTDGCPICIVDPSLLCNIGCLNECGRCHGPHSRSAMELNIPQSADWSREQHKRDNQRRVRSELNQP